MELNPSLTVTWTTKASGAVAGASSSINQADNTITSVVTTSPKTEATPPHASSGHKPPSVFRHYCWLLCFAGKVIPSPVVLIAVTETPSSENEDAKSSRHIVIRRGAAVESGSYRRYQTSR
ncbi:hypothetical protein J6590_045891 [Homalodisca vitripennis]|nr:hypothetical protein J6590_045891 [Homalodisca vitripennis]